MTDQQQNPMGSLDLDTRIRLRWALHDIKGKPTKWSPVDHADLKTLLEMGFIELRDEVPVLTSNGESASWG